MAAVNPLKLLLNKITKWVEGVDFLPFSMGGTGQVSFTDGDLLVGDTDTGLEKLTLGAEGSILVSQGGTAAWADGSAYILAEIRDGNGAVETIERFELFDGGNAIGD